MSDEHQAGNFCWVELATSDPEAAKSFYSELFGWTSKDTSAGEFGTYTMLQLGGKDVGGLYQLSPDQASQGVPPNWLSYVSVDDVDAATAKAKELGGSVFVEPMDVMEAGRMSVLADPTGASFALWQARENKGSGVFAEPGARCWHELLTRDRRSAGPFYAGLFGWDPQEKPMGDDVYTEFHHGECATGGMLEMNEQFGDAPPHWMIYFAVDDCDESAARIETLGGKLIHPPTEIPTVGKFAIGLDPEGAAFSIIKLAPEVNG